MKYIRLFEQFEEGHKFDILDLFTISPSEVEELFFKELKKETPDLENIQVFLDSGLVDVHTKDGYGYTPLHWVAHYNQLELAKLLISSEAEAEAKNNGGSTPLHEAAYYNSLELAKLLISSGADLEAKDEYGRTPLHWAAGYNYLELAQLLISSGAEVNVKDDRGWTPLDMADFQEMQELLISHGGVQ